MKPFTLAQFRKFLRAEVELAGGVRALARVLGVAPQRISEVLTHPGSSPQQSLLAALRFRKCSTLLYERTK